jgi:predicted Zn-dependent peptidase
LAARLADVELRAHLSNYLQRDSPPLGVAPETRRVSAQSLRERRRAWLRSDAKSDVQLPQEARTELQRVAPERH